jgi:predicted nucleotidyltransferase
MKQENDVHSSWRIALAKEISNVICTIPGIKAIIIGGSVARGYADQFSDLEIPLFWSRVPSAAVRKSLVAMLKAEFLTPFDGPAREDNISLKGFQIDLWHNSVAFEERVIKNVLQNFDNNLGSSNFFDTIRTGIPLFGEEIVQHWKEKTQHYPRELAVKNITESMQNLTMGNKVFLIVRNNPTMIYEWITSQQKQIFLILLALNQQHFPTYKWMYQTLETMLLKPADTVKRFRDVYRRPFNEAIEDTNQMIDETVSIVSKYYPEIDLNFQAKQRFQERRPFGKVIF